MSIPAAVGIIAVVELRLLAEGLTNRGRAEPEFLHQSKLPLAILLITSTVSCILGKVANSMAGAAPILSLVGKSFEVITAVTAVACGIIAISTVFWIVHKLICQNDLDEEAAGPSATLRTDFQNFSHEYRQSRRVLRERENGQRLPLIERNTIERASFDDAVLSQRCCPITEEPIRHVAIDPHSGRMYERAAIVAWIERHHTSPLTTEPLRTEDLLSSAETQLIINNQLHLIQLRREGVRRDIEELLAQRQLEQPNIAEFVN
jgi:hypothetical protein